MKKLYRNIIWYLLLIPSFFYSVIIQAQCPVSVYAGEDIILCTPPSPGPIQLEGSISGPYLNFNWSPTAGMTGATTLNPTINVPQNNTYILTANAVDLSTNLITNGDFESGNTAFTTNYTYSPGDLYPEGVYEVMTDPSDSHPDFAACSDHTGGGQMMVVNGNGAANQSVWCQNVSVQPNTQYAFTAWATSVTPASPALLQFSVNGAILGTLFNVGTSLCNWQQFYALWNSGVNTSIDICVVNQNTALSGNDFAIDDISFSPVCTVKDTVKVQLVNVTASATPFTSFIPCEGAEITLNGTGSSGPDYTYLWETPNGNIVSGENTLHPVVNAAGTYNFTVTYTNGSITCSKTVGVIVAQSPNPLSAWITPPLPLGCGGNTSILFGNSSQSNVSYSWTTVDGNIVSGANVKNCNINQAGTYTLLVTNLTSGCTATAEITVAAATNPPIANATTSGNINCFLPTATLSGNGSSTGSNITYTWSALSGGNITSGQNTLNATVNGGGVYVLSVKNTTNNCITLDTVTVIADLVAPTINIPQPAVFNCAVDTVPIGPAPTGTNTYTWSTSNGNIVAPNNTSSIQVTSPGLYTVTVTNPANGCSATATTTVTSNTTPPIAQIATPGSLTCTQNSVQLSGTGSSTGAAIDYLWTGPGLVSGQDSLVPVVNAPGTYTLIVINQQNACRDTASVMVSADANTISAVANAPDTLDCLTTSMVLNANGSSSGPGFTYQWSTSNGMISLNPNTANPTVTAPGTYQLLLTNPANGCTSVGQAVVIQNITPPSVTIAVPDTLSCTVTSLSLLATNSNTGSYTYLWGTSNGNIASGNTSTSPVINAPGTYTTTVTNTATGCSAAFSVVVQQEAGLPIATIQSPDTITCTSPVVQLDASGSSSGLTIAWSASNGGQFTGTPNSLTPTVNAPGTYQLLLTNPANGCTATTAVTVVENRVIPIANAGPDGLLTCTNPQYVLNANSGAYNYLWQTASGSIAQQQISVTSAGNYVLQITDPINGCVDTDTVVVSVNQQAPPVTVATPQLLTCTTTSTSLGINNTSPTYTYNWQTTNGNIVTGQSTSTPVINDPGTYITTVTNPTNGCTTLLSVDVSENTQAPTVQITAPAILTCTDSVITLSSSSNTTTVQWSTIGGHFTTPALQQNNVTVNSPGTYQILATTLSNGCTATASVTVLQDIVPPTVDAGTNGTLSCLTTSLSLSGTASTGTQVQWTTGNGTIFSGAQTLTPVITSAGTYTITGTNPINGCKSSDQVVIANDAGAPIAAILAPAQLSCTTTQVTLNGQGSSLGTQMQYNWQASNGGTIFSGPNTLTPVVTSAGTYTLTVTNSNNGCTATASSIVTLNNQVPQVNAGPTATITCQNTTATLQGTVIPAGTMLWSTSNGTLISGQNSNQLTAGSVGTYTLTATHPISGCTASATTTVAIDTIHPSANIAAPALLTCTTTETTISGAVSQPGTGLYTATWTTTTGHIVSGSGTTTPLVDAPGTYIWTVKNTQNGCQSIFQTIVNQNIMPPTAVATPAAVINCLVLQPALNGTGSSANGQYLWTGPQIVTGANSLTPIVGAAGDYTLRVTNPVNGCTATAVVVVSTDIQPPVAQVASPQTLTCVLLQSTLTASIQQPATAYTLEWTTSNGHILSGVNSPVLLIDEPGNYQLLVTNTQNGCSATFPTSVLENTTPPTANAGPDALLHCNQPTANLTASAQTGMQYLWQTSGTGHILQGGSTAIATIDQPGTYMLTVTNPTNGCTASDNVVVTEVSLPVFDTELVQPDCHTPTGSIEMVSVSGGLAPYSYSFNGGTTFIPDTYKAQLAPGTYQLVIKDQYGCTATDEAVITVPNFPSVSLPALYRIELGDSIQLVPLTVPAAPQIQSWAWTNSTSLSCQNCPKPYATPFTGTDYQITITDNNGCTATATTRVEVDIRRHIYVPNVFHPDGDAENNRFLVFGRGVVEIKDLSVFDRWGNMVWRGEHLAANDQSTGWDGTMRNKKVSPGVYVWQAIIVFPDGATEIYSGDVTVLW